MQVDIYKGQGKGIKDIEKTESEKNCFDYMKIKYFWLRTYIQNIQRTLETQK